MTDRSLKGHLVLQMLIGDSGWSIHGDDFDSIVYDEGVKKITREQFEAGFAQYDSWKAQKDAEAESKKTALLNKLGITEEEAKLLLG